MIHLDSVAVQAGVHMETQGIDIYDAKTLSQWIIRSWSGVGSLSMELLQGAFHGTLLQRYMCRLAIAYLTGDGLDEAWEDYVAVMDATSAVETSEDCPICYENVGKGVVLKCNHAYHPECISTWFIKSTTCPMCRYDVVG